MPWTITRPALDDLEEMGRVHVRVWQEAYAGLMPADYLAGLDPPVGLELYAINVLRRAHGTGLADDLMTHVIGDRAAYLWVLEGNARARAFYRRHGFADDGGRKAEPDTGVLEIRMARGAVAR